MGAFFLSHISDTYLDDHQLNSANISAEMASYLDFYIKMIGKNIETSKLQIKKDFEFHIVNFPSVSGDVSFHKDVTFLSRYDLLDVVLHVTLLISILKTLTDTEQKKKGILNLVLNYTFFI